MKVFITANSGDKLTRGSAGTPLTADEDAEDLADMPLIWKDSIGSDTEWTLTGSQDGSGVFIKCAKDRYLVASDGGISISPRHNGPWSMKTASNGRVTLMSAQGNFLKQHGGTDGAVVLATRSEGDETLFSVTLKEMVHGPEVVAPPEEGEAAGSATNGTSTKKPNEVIVYIIGGQNFARLRQKPDASTALLDLNGDWDAPTQWKLVNTGEDDGTVFIESANGRYLKDNAGELQLDTKGTPGHNPEEMMWTLAYDDQRGGLSIMSKHLNFIEAFIDRDILGIRPGLDGPPPVPRKSALWQLQVKSVALF